jgi:hypothetical protein
MTENTATANGTEPDPFEDPGSSSFIDKNMMGRLEGALLLFMPLEYSPNFPTVNSVPGKPSPAVKSDVYVIDCPLDPELTGEEFSGAWQWQVGVVSSLQSKIGKVVPVRLVKGPSKKGEFAWVLNALPNPSADRTKALTWYQNWKAAQERDPFSAPAAS